MKRAFTLIELLVVIAIIAILAAILFPVFAQAKAAAKKSASLNNVKQIGTAMHLYITDYDDVTPSTYILPNPGGGGVDIYQLFQLYVKNMDIFFSPNWEKHWTGAQSCNNAGTPPGQFVPSGTNVDRCLGYGYNWGFGVWAGGALVGFQQTLPDGTTFLPGINATSVEEVARHAAFGDTYNGRRYTMSAIGSILTHYDGPQRNSSLRQGGQFNFAFVDGHAKSFAMQGYTFNPAANPKGAGYIGVPSKSDEIVPMFCSSPTVTVRPANLGLPLPDMPCQQFIQLALSGAITPLTKWSN
jgi:prepilin-type N-terminal cleavage/methylation domain-containing protein/prepilin-type processing-associated H-X9-DG protein